MNGAEYFHQIKSKVKVIAFDFDGVLVDSVNIKTEAFKELFKDRPEHIEKIIKYHKKNEGISRFVKFQYFFENILKEKYTDELGKDLGEKFSNIVFEKVCSSIVIPSAIEFIRSVEKCYPLYIISGTPQVELVEIVKTRGWANYFKKIIGSPTQKGEGLRWIADKEKIATEDILFFGDTKTDFNAAKKMNTFFIGRADNGTGPFPPGTALVRNFESLDHQI